MDTVCAHPFLPFTHGYVLTIAISPTLDMCHRKPWPCARYRAAYRYVRTIATQGYVLTFPRLPISGSLSSLCCV
jgi:hypothetical protein